MSTPLPPPEPPTPGSSWKASDALYVAGSATGLIGGVTTFATAHPEIAAFIGPVSVFLFWAASYAAKKGD